LVGLSTGSEAAIEVYNGEQRADGSAWGEDPVRTAYAASAAFLFASLDCLQAMADSVNLLTTAYVPNVIARAAMEAGSQAWWLLEPKIGARRRAIRSILVRAKSARYLSQAARKIDPVGQVTQYGEDQPTVRSYARDLGISYICNDDRTECEGEKLPGYNARAAALESAMKMIAAYNIYSGATHAELYSVAQGWRQSPIPGQAAPSWERAPDRQAVWATVIAAAGFAAMPAYRAIILLGRNARAVELTYSMRKIGQLTRRMDLPPEWRY
jgi:hypothetical protein